MSSLNNYDCVFKILNLNAQALYIWTMDDSLLYSINTHSLNWLITVEAKHLQSSLILFDVVSNLDFRSRLFTL